MATTRGQHEEKDARLRPRESLHKRLRALILTRCKWLLRLRIGSGDIFCLAQSSVSVAHVHAELQESGPTRQFGSSINLRNAESKQSLG